MGWGPKGWGWRGRVWGREDNIIYVCVGSVGEKQTHERGVEMGRRRKGEGLRVEVKRWGGWDDKTTHTMFQ